MAKKITQKTCTHPRAARYSNRSDATYWCSVCEATNVPAPGPVPSIPVGVYRLNKPVPNPYGKDGRSGDWQKQGEIEPGLFYVRAFKEVDYSEDEPKYVECGNEITKNGERDYNRVNPRSTVYDDFLAALEPVEPTDGQWLIYQQRTHGYDAEGDALVVQALKSGMLTRAQVEALIDANSKEEQE